MKDLETRVAQLEKSNRRYRTVLVAIAACVAALALFGFGQDPVPELLKAKEFQVIGADGKVLATVGSLEGMGAVSTYNSSGNLLVDVVPSQSGAGGIVVYDGKGNKNMVVTDVTGGGGSLVVNNGEFNPVLKLGRNTNQAGSVTVSNKAGAAIGLFTGDTEEGGVVITNSASGSQTARLPN